MKKRGISRFLAFVLTLALCMSSLTCVPVPQAAAAGTEGDGFALFLNGEAAVLYAGAEEPAQVLRAMGDLQADVEQVTGQAPLLTEEAAVLGSRAVIVGTAGRGGLIDSLAAEGKLDLSAVSGEWEAFTIQIVEQPAEGVGRALVIAGSDMRGTIYGIYELSEQIGVSPWYWWGDVPVERLDEVILEKASAEKTEKPDVRYRGIFLNDEENFSYWSRLLEDETDSPGTPGANAYARVFELLLRLKANSIWPAMHEESTAFNAELNPETGVSFNAETADRYGVIVGSSHCEMLLRNNATEWVPWCEANEGKYNLQKINNDWKSSYDYTVNAEAMEVYWEEAVARNYKFENMYTIGLRGVHDAGINCSALSDKSIAGKAGVVKQAVEAQLRILEKYEEKYYQETGEHKTFLKIYCSYKEAADYFKYDISLPEDTVIVWGDDNYGYLREVGTAEELAAYPNQGVYYHVSYLGTPLSYLWLASTPLELMYEEMSKAYGAGSDDCWILNVGDLKPAEIPMTFLLGMAWDHDRYDDTTISDFLEAFAAQSFALEQEDAAAVAAALQEYYAVCFAKKPEYFGKSMGTGYSLVSYGDEGERQIERLSAACDVSSAIYEKLPEAYRDAYFQLVQYMLQAARDTLQKHIYQQKNQLYMSQGRFASVNAYARAAEDAYDRILSDLKFYNKTMSGGRFDGILDPYTSIRSLPTISGAPEVTYLSEELAAEGVGSVCEGQTTGGESVTLTFHSLSDDRRFIDLFNTGLSVNTYTITCDPAIRLTAADGRLLSGTEQDGRTVYSGTVEVETRLIVSIDWSAAEVGTSAASITVADAFGNEKSYPVSITRASVDPAAEKAAGHDGYYETNGVVAIEAEHYSASTTVNGQYWARVEGLGRTGSAVMKNYPDLSASSGAIASDYAEKSPCLEYEVYFETTGSYTVSFYRLPTLNEGTNKTNRTVFQLDDGDFYIFRGNSKVDSEYSNETWRMGVLANVDVMETSVTVSSVGWHTIRIYKYDAGAAFDRIVLRSAKVSAAASLLGPQESFTTTAGYTVPKIGQPPVFSLSDISYAAPEEEKTFLLDFSADASKASSGYTGVDNTRLGSAAAGYAWDSETFGNVKAVTRSVSSGVSTRDQGFVYGTAPAAITLRLPRAGKYVVGLAVGDRLSGGLSVSGMTVTVNGSKWIDGLNVAAGRTVERGLVVDCADTELRLELSGTRWAMTALEVSPYTEPAQDDGTGAFLPASDGGIYIEAEAALENSSYAWNTAGTDADGSSWMETFGLSGTAVYSGPNKGNNFSNTSLGSNSGPKMYYKINFAEAGSYSLYALVKSQADVDDSILVSMDGGTAAALNDTKDTGGAFKWFKLGSQISVSTAGEHILSIWEREDGIVLDRIILTKNGTHAGTAGKMCREGASVDRSGLDRLIAQAEALDAADYLEAQFSLVRDALQKAKTVPAGAAQTEIDAAAQLLSAAMEALTDPSILDADVTTGRAALYTFEDGWDNALNADETAFAWQKGTTNLPQIMEQADGNRVVRIYGGGTGNASGVSLPNPVYGTDAADGFTVSFRAKGVSFDTYGCLWTVNDGMNYTWLTGGMYFGYSGSRGYVDMNKSAGLYSAGNDVWYTLTLTLTEEEAVLYVDGKRIVSSLDADYTSGYNTSDLTRVMDVLRSARTVELGGRAASWGSGAFFADDVILFDRALSEAEAARLSLNLTDKAALLAAIEAAEAEAAKTDLYLPDSIAAYRAEIEKARAVAYSSGATEQAVAAALSSLEAAKSLLKTNQSEAAAAAEVDLLISALPDAVSLTAGDADAVQAARAAYSALSDYGKGLVTGLARLIEAERKIAELTGGAGILNLICNDADNNFNWVVRTNAQVGDQAYSDRKQLFFDETLPEELVGCDWIRTAMNSKSWNAGNVLCSFDVACDTTLYVAWPLAWATPDWLNTSAGWENTETTFTFWNSDRNATHDSVMQLYRREVCAGEHVELGCLGTASAAIYLVFLQHQTPETPEPSLPQKTLSRTVRVACVGDSITYGSGATDRSTTAYPAQLQSLLGDSYDVRNFGLGGTTLMNSTDKPYTAQTQYTDSLAFEPDIVIIMLGTNDSKPKNSAQISTDYKIDYLTLIKAYQALSSNPKIYIATSPFCPNDPESPGTNDIIGPVIEAQIVPLQKEIAEETGLELIDIFSATWRQSIFPDSVHPNDEGYRLLAKTFYTALYNYLPAGVTVLGTTEADFAALDAALAAAGEVERTRMTEKSLAVLDAAVAGANALDRSSLTKDDQSTVDALTASLRAAVSALVVYGDVDGDGKITVSDVVLLRQLIIAGVWSDRELDAADFDRSGILTVSDVVDLRQWIVTG